MSRQRFSTDAQQIGGEGAGSSVAAQASGPLLPCSMPGGRDAGDGAGGGVAEPAQAGAAVCHDASTGRGADASQSSTVRACT